MPKRMMFAALLAGGFALSIFGLKATAVSDFTGAYARIDKVVFEPDASAPERIQIWGAFALASKQNRFDYEEPRRGYFYFSLKPGKETVCRKEWADLKAVAGTGQIVSFGSRYDAAPVTVRKADAKPENPDTYPKSWGMTKVRARDYGPLNQLNKLQGKKSAAPAPPSK